MNECAGGEGGVLRVYTAFVCWTRSPRPLGGGCSSLVSSCSKQDLLPAPAGWRSWSECVLMWTSQEWYRSSTSLSLNRCRGSSLRPCLAILWTPVELWIASCWRILSPWGCVSQWLCVYVCVCVWWWVWVHVVESLIADAGTHA